MNNEKFKKHTIRTIVLLKELAIKAKTNSDRKSHGYAEGVLMGYYSIITTLKRQAFTFCIDQKELGLADIKPDVDLLGLGRNPDVDYGEDNWAIDLMTEEKVEGYLVDSITLLKEQAIEAKKEADHPQEGSEDYSKGELVAYASVFSLLKHQALAFNINEQELRLDDIEPISK